MEGERAEDDVVFRLGVAPDFDPLDGVAGTREGVGPAGKEEDGSEDVRANPDAGGGKRHGRGPPARKADTRAPERPRGKRVPTVQEPYRRTVPRAGPRTR